MELILFTFQNRGLRVRKMKEKKKVGGATLQLAES